MAQKCHHQVPPGLRNNNNNNNNNSSSSNRNNSIPIATSNHQEWQTQSIHLPQSRQQCHHHPSKITRPMYHLKVDNDLKASTVVIRRSWPHPLTIHLLPCTTPEAHKKNILIIHKTRRTCPVPVILVSKRPHTVHLNLRRASRLLLATLPNSRRFRRHSHSTQRSILARHKLLMRTFQITTLLNLRAQRLRSHRVP